MTRVRLTAAERGEEVLRAAVQAFGESGYAGTRTDEIARLAGVSQPYVIRLFGTKQQLFLATLRTACDQIEQIFTAAAERRPDLDSLGEAYQEILAQRELLLVLLHGFSASSDPVIGPAVRKRFGRIFQLVRDLTGASVRDAREFMASGMLLTVMAAMKVIGPDAVETDWAAAIMADLESESSC